MSTYTNDDQIGPPVYSGEQACSIDVLTAPSNGYLEFGKRWSTSAAFPVGTVLEGRVRVQLSRAGLGASSRLAAFEYPVVAPKSQTFLESTTDWQTVDVHYETKNLLDSYSVRFQLEIVGAQAGDQILVDYATFGPSDPLFNAGTTPDQEVLTSGYSLLLEGTTGELISLRELPLAPTLGLGPDLIRDTGSELFEIKLPGSLELSSQHTPVLTQLSTGGLRFDYPTAIPGYDFSVDVHGNETAPEIEFQLEFHQVSTSTHLEWTTCPVLNTVGKIGPAKEDDRYFTPNFCGKLIVPNLQQGDLSTEAIYPGNASMQWLAFYDDTSGLMLYAADPNVEAKALRVESKPSSGEGSLRIKHRLPHEKGHHPASYPVVLAPCRGDWRMGAGTYRDWALEQPWSNSLDPNMPAWVAERPTVFNANLKAQQIGIPLVDLNDGTRWKQLLDEWSLQVGGPMMPLFRSFEPGGVYANGLTNTPLQVHGTSRDPLTQEYNVLTREADIATNWQSTAASGHINMAMVAGLKWMVERTQYPDQLCSPGLSYWVAGFDQSFGDPQNMSAICLREDTTPAPTATVFPSGGANWDFDHGIFCPWHPQTAASHATFAGHLASLGIVHYEIDQYNTPECGTCFHSGHGHDMGPGRWYYEEIGKVFDAILAAGRAQDSDFVMSMEHPAEYYIPWMYAFWARPHRLYGWSGGHPANLTVPAFQYVYSSRVQTLTADVVRLFIENQNPVAQERQYPSVLMARGMVSGAIPYISFAEFQLIYRAGLVCGDSDPLHELEPTPSRTDPDHLRQMTSSVRTGRGPARTMFQRGLMVQTEGGGFPEFTFQWPESWGTLHPVAIPEVSHSAWYDPIAETYGLLLANAVDASLAPEVTCMPPTHIDGRLVPPATEVQVHVNGIAVFDSTYGALLADTTLLAGDVLYIEIDPF